MSTRQRFVVLGVGVGLLAAFLCSGLRLLPAFGDYRGPYGDIINAAAQSERNVTDMVTAVNFDYRAIDTVGEEFIVFVSVAGVTLVLRRTREEHEHEAGDEPQPSPRTMPAISDAVRAACLLLVAPVVLLGVYIVSHGQISPGGGFQGGIIMATALLLVYLADRYRRMTRIGSRSIGEIADSLGAGGFVIVGLAALVAGAAFLQQVLPLGVSSTLTEGGTLGLISFSIGLEVTGAIVVILSEFLEQALQITGT